MPTPNRRMRMHALAVATAFGLTSAVAFTATAAPRLNISGLVESRYDGFLVKYRDASVARASRVSLQKSLDTTARMSGAAGLSLRATRRIATGAELVKPSRSLDRVQAMMLLRAFANDPNVEYVELNRILRVATPTAQPTLLKPNDPSYSRQWGFTSAAAGINAEAAWDITQGEGVVVAVVDTGITRHDDLNANIVAGYDFVNNDSDPTDTGSGASHGTHVSGTVAALTNNARGVAGTAPKARVQPVRVLGNDGSGSYADIIDGLTWASGGTVAGAPANKTPAEVINLSLGGDGACSNSMQAAITAAVGRGSTLVIAAGNSNADVRGFTPANCNNVISVASVDSTGRRSSFSNYGTLIDIAAPGGAIYSTVNTNTYGNMSGTSMAAPHVAGVAALLQSVVTKPLSPAQLEAAIKAAARKFTTTPDRTIGPGYLDAKLALAYVCQNGACEAPGGAPVAKFEYKADGLNVSFNDLSTDSDGKIVKWEWKFGDGQTSTSASPSHKYTAKGDYTVTLTVTDDKGLTHSSEQKLSVSDGTTGKPDARFEYKAEGLEVNFNNLSSDPDGKLVKWQWNFGDGNTSSQESVLYTYKSPGNYTVVLTVTDDAGNTASYEQKVSVGTSDDGKPVAKFEYKADGLEVNFTDVSTDADGKIVSRAWNFGDGSTSTLDNVLHTYKSGGNYTVVLTVTDDAGNASTTQQQVQVGGGAAPSAKFEFKADGLEVGFNDLSSDDGKIVSWLWDFGDGDTSRGTSPVKKYNQAGTYKVRLTVTDDTGLTGVSEQSVTVAGDSEPPKPSFEFKIDGASVGFNDTSIDPDGKIVAWKWSFGDGASATTPSPVHDYKADGVYTVVLEVTDDSGISARTEQKVTIDALDATPDAGFGFKINGLEVAFTDVSKDDGKIVAWNWDFGDGSSSELQNPLHTYAKPGEYAVTLVVRDDAGQKAEVTHKVTVTAPVDEVLENGKAIKVAGAIDSRRYFKLVVPAGAGKLQFNTFDGSGDLDMYVRFGEKPTTDVYDCRPYVKGSTESCAMPEAKAGTWWVMLDGYRAYSDVSLVASFAAATEVKTYASADDVLIDDLKTVESPITVSGRDGAKGLADSRVGVSIVHTHIGDLRIALVSPSGKEYVLHSNGGGSGDNIFNTYSVDLSGETINGLWKLRVTDSATGDVGAIYGWTVTF